MAISEYMRDLRAAVGPRLLEVPSVSILIRDDQGRVLLVHQPDPGVWSTPGGAVEPAETPADAAVREAWEETGLYVRLTRLVGVYGGSEFVVEYGNGDRTSYLMTVFEAVRLDGIPRPDDDETDDVRYFSSNDIDAVTVPGWLSEVLTGMMNPSAEASYRRATWTPPRSG